MKQLSIPMTKAEKLGTWIYLFVQMFLLPPMMYIINDLLPRPLSDAGLNFVFFSLNFICVTVICHKYLLASVRKALAQPSLCLRSAFLGLLLYYVGSFAVNFLIAYVKPDFINANDSSIADLVQDNYTLISIGTVLLVPPVEEVFYRGLIFRGLFSRSRVAAYAVSAAIFSAIHITGYLGVYDPVSLGLSFLQYLPAGLCLGWAYAKADNILAPILIHMAVNQIASYAMR